MKFLNKEYVIAKRLFRVIGITFLLFLWVPASAQVSDTVKTVIQDSLATKKALILKEQHSPKRAALLSTALPGAGQAYNKKYWKIPVIYVGFAALAYSINFNQTKYVKYRNVYKSRIINPSAIDDYTGKYTNDNLLTLQKYYHRYRDLSIIEAGLLYILNIVDASVDAHLFSFDVNDDLSFNIHPAWINTAGVNHYATGLSLNIKF